MTTKEYKKPLTEITNAVKIDKEGFKIGLDENRSIEGYKCSDYSIAFRIVNGKAVTRIRFSQAAVYAMWKITKELLPEKKTKENQKCSSKNLIN